MQLTLTEEQSRALMIENDCLSLQLEKDAKNFKDKGT
jgi:hypothetical protein